MANNSDYVDKIVKDVLLVVNNRQVRQNYEFLQSSLDMKRELGQLKEKVEELEKQLAVVVEKVSVLMDEIITKTKHESSLLHLELLKLKIALRPMNDTEHC
jgi:phage shock protein A